MIGFTCKPLLAGFCQTREWERDIGAGLEGRHQVGKSERGGNRYEMRGKGERLESRKGRLE